MSKLIYVSAQPDVPYFHWQCEIYGHNFTEKGIDPSDIHILFSMVNDQKNPSEGGLKLKDRGYNVYFYEDLRDNKNYIPSIKPYLVSKWLEENPKYGDVFFLHDSDIIFRELPDYSKYLNDDICYMANTVSYIGYEYLKQCSKNYSIKYGIDEFKMIEKMTDIMGIEYECLIFNKDNSGGGQYIIKNTTYQDWYKIYVDSNSLYETLVSFHNSYPINNGIQIWTAEMWSLLWNLWCLEKETRIIDELNFSWATDNLDIYYKRPILHMAGVLEKDKNNMFYKGGFINENPIDKLREDEKYFDYIKQDSSTIKYVEVIKSFLKKTKF